MITPVKVRPSLLFVAHNFGSALGGVGTSAERIVRHLCLDYDVTVITYTKALPAHELVVERSLGISLRQYAPPGDQAEGTQYACDVVVAAIHELSPHAVVGFYLGELTYGALLAARLRNVPFIACGRGNDIDLDIFGPRAFQIFYQLEQSTRVCCVSREMEGKIAAWCPRSRPHFVPNGVDPVRFPFAERSRAKVPVIGMFGEIKVKKGLALLLEAIDLSRCTLRIVGRMDDASHRVLQGFLMVHPEYRARVETVPYLKRHLDLVAAYQGVDIVCIPSMHDGMPNVMLEAMSCGSIVVASDVGGALDVITHRRNGFLFPRGDTHALAHELNAAFEALVDPSSAIQREARSTIEQTFTWSEERSHYRSLVEEVIREHQDRGRARAV